jgi:DNA polymerase III subunit chi
MAELWFYHLERSPLERALAPLLEKCLQRGWRSLVRGTDAARLKALDEALWLGAPSSFLPHGLAGGAHDARQPVLLTADSQANPNASQALFLVDGAPPDYLDGFERAMLLFDGADEAALAAARRHWKTSKAQGMVLAYWKQDGAGRWEKQA